MVVAAGGWLRGEAVAAEGEVTTMTTSPSATAPSRPSPSLPSF